MPSLSDVTGRRRKPSPEQVNRVQSEAESVADVTAPPEPAGLRAYDESVAGAREATGPDFDLEET